jgi:hypothetical protein
MMPGLSPLHGVLFAFAVTPFAVDPLAPPDTTPRYLDSGQFAAFGIGLALVVTLLAVIAVGVWSRR